MKKKNFLLSVAVACLAASFATIGCGGNARKAKSAGETLVLNLYDTSGGVDWTDTITGNPAGCGTGGYWDSTYTTRRLAFGKFVFDHNGGLWPGSTIKYWGGFTFGTNGDTFCYSDTFYCKCCRPPVWCDSTGSSGWINNQWGVIAGAGLDTIASYKPQEGAPYLIAFGTGLDVWLKDSALFKPLEVYICNHPWPYYGNIYGDGFARPLNQSGDYFKLKISGVVGGTETLLAEHFLAQNTTGTLSQSNKWEQVDLSENDQNVQLLRFRLETTDTGQFGPNTAFYFCMDKLKVEKADAAASPVAAQQAVAKKAKETLIRKHEFADYLTLKVHKDSEAVIYDAAGETVLKTTLKVGENKVDTRKLPAGKYLLKLHHRTIHLVKK
jgi:hypothetical protein